MPMLLLLVFVAVLSQPLLGQSGEFRFPSFLPLRIHFFLFGMLCALYFAHFRAAATEYHRWIVLTVAALAAVSDVFFFYPVLIWLGFFYLVLSHDSGAIELVRRLVLLRPARWLGEISYSFYILHMPIIYAVAGFIAGTQPLDSRWRFAAMLLVIAFSITLLLSAICHRYVEKPFIAFAKKRFTGLPVAATPAPAPSS